MGKSIVVILFLTVLHKVHGFSCPSGFFEFPREDACIISIEKPSFYLDAVRQCSDLDSVPVKIRNIYENSYVWALLPVESDSIAPYIGVEKKPSGDWTYADGSPLVYQNWATGEPSNNSSSAICALMDSSNGKWYASECSYARPFICSLDFGAVRCPYEQDWVYFKETDSCYYLQNFTFDTTGSFNLYNFSRAEADCVKIGSHLASVHSKVESDFLFDMTYTINGGSLGGYFSRYPGVLLGLYGTGVVGNGANTDGTPVDYVGYPITVMSTPYYWTIRNDRVLNYRDWDYQGASGQATRFICKRPANHGNQLY